MKGNAQVITSLNHLLAGELTAMDQYFIHSRMYHDWGFDELYEHVNHEMGGETEHADRLIKRLLFLEATPDLTKRSALNIGHDVPAMLKNDLDLEYQVISDLKEAIGICERNADFQSREILEDLLEDTEEDHTYWLEQQLGLIDKVGINNYLQSHM
jgi:bacterioferritin